MWPSTESCELTRPHTCHAGIKHAALPSIATGYSPCSLKCSENHELTRTKRERKSQWWSQEFKPVRKSQWLRNTVPSNKPEKRKEILSFDLWCGNEKLKTPGQKHKHFHCLRTCINRIEDKSERLYGLKRKKNDAKGPSCKEVWVYLQGKTGRRNQNVNSKMMIICGYIRKGRD